MVEKQQLAPVKKPELVSSFNKSKKSNESYKGGGI
jgi:hypothetical protein